jgi:methyltransferase (TIGR00027 family)
VRRRVFGTASACSASGRYSERNQALQPEPLDTNELHSKHLAQRATGRARSAERGSALLSVCSSSCTQLFQPDRRTQAQKERALRRLNLEKQRKQARALLKAVRAQDPDAIRRFALSRSRSATSSTVSLHDAQRVIARENGFASWARLKAHIRAETLRHPLLLSALLGAAHNALETELPRPLYRDSLARPLAGQVGWSALAATRSTQWPGYSLGPDPYVSVVTRFFDDALLSVVTKSKLTQVVILGAGMDTRAFRLAWPPSVTVFEVDRGDIFEHKESVLEKVRARAACVRKIVASTSRRACTAALVKSGFDPQKPSAMLIGDLLYRDAAAAEGLLRDITAISTKGGWIGFALPSEQTLRSAFMTPFLKKLEAIGLPSWQFGVDDPDAWLATYGWAATSAVVGAPEANYGRWPLAYVPRAMPAVPRFFFTQAWLGAKENR